VLLSLDEALRLGTGESETVWIARAGVMRAMGSEQVSRSGLFPQLAGSASYTRTLRSQFSGISFGPTQGAGTDDALQNLPFGQLNQYSLGLNLSQLLFDGGQTVARARAAAARRRSAEIDVDAAQAEALLDVTGAYFDARLADRLVEIAEASLAQQEEILRQTGVAYQVGEKAEFEALQARVSRDNQVPAVLQNRSRRQLAYLRLAQLLNLPATDTLELTTPLEELPARFATSADATTDARAPVRQAGEEVTANRHLLDSARGERLPSISLGSAYDPVAYPSGGLPRPGDFRENWTVSINLSVPILTGGRIAGDVLAARGGLSQAQARLAQTREAAELDLATSRLDLGDAQAILKSDESTVEQARRAYEIAQLRYREGLSSQIELQNARLLFEQAEVNRAQALRNVQVARARLALIRDLPLSAAPAGTSTNANTAAAAVAAGSAPGTRSTGTPTSIPGATIPGTSGVGSNPGGPTP
jgi:outer membrane protein